MQEREAEIDKLRLLIQRCCCSAGYHLAQHLLQRRGIIRQGGEIDRRASADRRPFEIAIQLTQSWLQLAGEHQRPRDSSQPVIQAEPGST